MNYFEFYNIPLTFLVEEGALRQTFYTNSKKYHPDFYTLASEEEQQRALELSTRNNEAYKTLSDFDRRMRYILELKGAIAAEGKNDIPQDFLLEMMDFNEALMELEMAFDTPKYQQLLADLDTIERGLLEEVMPLLKSFDEGEEGETALAAAKDYYFKKRYLLRIRENLDKFAD